MDSWEHRSASATRPSGEKIQVAPRGRQIIQNRGASTVGMTLISADTGKLIPSPHDLNFLAQTQGASALPGEMGTALMRAGQGAVTANKAGQIVNPESLLGKDAYGQGPLPMDFILSQRADQRAQGRADFAAKGVPGGVRTQGEAPPVQGGAFNVTYRPEQATVYETEGQTGPTGQQIPDAVVREADRITTPKILELDGRTQHLEKLQKETKARLAANPQDTQAPAQLVKIKGELLKTKAAREKETASWSGPQREAYQWAQTGVAPDTDWGRAQLARLQPGYGDPRVDAKNRREAAVAAKDNAKTHGAIRKAVAVAFKGKPTLGQLKRLYTKAESSGYLDAASEGPLANVRALVEQGATIEEALGTVFEGTKEAKEAKGAKPLYTDSALLVHARDGIFGRKDANGDYIQRPYSLGPGGDNDWLDEGARRQELKKRWTVYRRRMMTAGVPEERIYQAWATQIAGSVQDDIDDWKAVRPGDAPLMPGEEPPTKVRNAPTDKTTDSEGNIVRMPQPRPQESAQPTAQPQQAPQAQPAAAPTAPPGPVDLPSLVQQIGSLVSDSGQPLTDEMLKPFQAQMGTLTSQQQKQLADYGRQRGWW